MSIRLRILVACLSLAVLTAALGVFTLAGQRHLGQLSLRMYDEAFMSVDFFRSAQAEFAALRAGYVTSVPEQQLRDLAEKTASDLAVAVERATSPEARRIAMDLRSMIQAAAQAGDDTAATTRRLDEAVPLFERGSEQFAQDGFVFRLQAEQMAHDSELTGEIAIGASVVVALLITASLSRSIVPPIRQATRIAREIARGRLDNEIKPKGSEEIMLLMGALSVMQIALAERQAAARQVEHLAHHDMLTGLANRLAFSKAMEQAVVQARDNMPLTLLLLDLDRFKPVNDSHGHATGDALLRAVAGRILRCAGADDRVARLGGDEFAILRLGTEVRSGEHLAQEIVASLSQPFTVNGVTVEIGVSVGLDAWSEGHTPDMLLHNADEALYAAKSAGRATWRRSASVTGHSAPKPTRLRPEPSMWS